MSTVLYERKVKRYKTRLNPPEPLSIPHKKRKEFKGINKTIVTVIVTLILLVFIMPLIYGVVTSLKSEEFLTKQGAPILPSSPATYTYQGKSYDLYQLENKEIIILKKGREESTILDIENNEITIWDGRWRTLEPVWKVSFKFDNFLKAWKEMKFPKLLFNTLFYTVLSTFGMVLSSALVAFGFARFKFPLANVAFIIVIATMILPPSVTLIPTYTFFHKIGLVGTWVPLILPCFFANAYNVFLLRQFFMGISRSLDEAAMIDGANYFTIFFKIIIPQAIPALVAVGLFHFFYCWNDFFGPLLYLAGEPDKFPISIGLSNFVNMYTEKVTMVQAASLLSTLIPVILFIFFQKFFIQGIVITGEDK